MRPFFILLTLAVPAFFLACSEDTQPQMMFSPPAIVEQDSTWAEWVCDGRVVIKCSRKRQGEQWPHWAKAEVFDDPGILEGRYVYPMSLYKETASYRYFKTDSIIGTGWGYEDGDFGIHIIVNDPQTGEQMIFGFSLDNIILDNCLEP